MPVRAARARRCCTRWRTCGSATWSPCAGGTTCGSTSRSPTCASVLCQAEATEYTNAWTTFANVEKSWAYVQDQLPSTHPIAADIPDLAAVEVNFDGITYAKGASVLKQLAAYVGLRASSWPACATTSPTHAFGNATLDDLLARAGGDLGPRPVRAGRAQWLRDHRPEHPAPGLRGRRATAGSPRSRCCRTAPRRVPARLRVAPAGRRHLRRRRTPGRLVRTAPRRAGRRRARAPRCPSWSASPRGKLVLVNDDDLTYCKAAPRRASRWPPLIDADRRHRRPAAPHPALVGGLGDDPGRRAAGPRLRRAGASAASAPRPRSASCSGCCCRRTPR